MDKKGNETSAKKGYLLSPKDLSILEILNKIPNVACLKIEGRMKQPEYVATVTRIYRKYLDKIEDEKKVIVSKEDAQDIAQIFNRGGFSTAYLESKNGKDYMCYEKPKNWGMYVGNILEYDKKHSIKVSNESKMDLVKGDGIEVWNGSNEDSSCIISNLTNNGKSYTIGDIHGKITIGDKVYRTSSKELNQKAKESYTRGFSRHAGVSCKVIIKENAKIKVSINDYEFNSSIKPEKAQKSPIDKEHLETQFRKTGNTPFEISNFEVDLDSGLFLPVSKINEIRRDAFSKYEEYLKSKNKRCTEKKPLEYLDFKVESNNAKIDSKKLSNETKNVSVLINIFNKDLLNLDLIDNYYINFKDALTNLDALKNVPKKKYLVFPTITKNNYAKLVKNNLEKIAPIFDGFVISNIGQIEYVKNYKKELIANYTMNIFNSYTVQLLKSLGFSKVILSVELTKNQINNIAKNCDNIELEVIAYGNTCVMTSEYCPVGSILGGFCKTKECSKPCIRGDRFYLKDRMGVNFRVLPDNIDCQSRIFNSKITSFEANGLNVNSIRLDFIDENFEEAQRAINIHKAGNKISGDEYTNGHINRPV